MFVIWVLFFKRKTAYEMRISDWSSDVCSSDLGGRNFALRVARGQPVRLSELAFRRNLYAAVPAKGLAASPRQKPRALLVRPAVPPPVAQGSAPDARQCAGRRAAHGAQPVWGAAVARQPDAGSRRRGDRKSTRLHSSN